MELKLDLFVVGGLADDPTQDDPVNWINALDWMYDGKPPRFRWRLMSLDRPHSFRYRGRHPLDTFEDAVSQALEGGKRLGATVLGVEECRVWWKRLVARMQEDGVYGQGQQA